MGGAVLAMFALGLVLSEGHAVDRAAYSAWWIAQNLFGGGSLFAALVTGPLEQTKAPLHCDAGVIFCTVAGLMNLVVMIDAFTVAERSVFPVGKPQEVVS
jgi:Na+/phosphate symporter